MQGVLLLAMLADSLVAGPAALRGGGYEAAMTEAGLVISYQGTQFVSGSRLTLFKPGYSGAYFSENDLSAGPPPSATVTGGKLNLTKPLPELEGELTYTLQVDEAGVAVSLRLRVGKDIAPSPCEFTVAMLPPGLFAGRQYALTSLLGESEWQALPAEKPQATGPGTTLLRDNVLGLKLRGERLEVSAEHLSGPRPLFYDMRSRDYREPERTYWLLYQWGVTRGEMLISTRLSARTLTEGTEQTRKEGRVVMAEGGQSTEVKALAVGRDAHAIEKAAAKELQQYLTRMCGRELPILEGNDASLPERGVIYVGRSEAALQRRLFTEREFEPLGAAGFVARARSGNVLLAGGGHQGTVYAVYRMLERLGCRFYANELETVPSRKVVRIRSPFDLTDRPAFEWRAMWGTIAPMKCGLSPGEWEAKVAGVDLPKMMAIPKGGFWHHTMGFLLPADKWFDQHSDYFAMLGGERKRFEPAVQQYCLSNPNLQRALTDAVLQWMADDPDPLYYPVHYGDVGNFCECEACKALYAEKGSVTDAVIWFLNQIAKETEPKFPDKFLTILAYWGTRRPPVKETPARNLLIVFCAISECQARPWTAPVNLKLNVCKDLEQWIALHPLGAKGVITFDYPTTYHFVGYPYPALYAYAENLRYYHRLGLRGAYVCGLTNGHLVHLYSYVMPRLLWSPEQDVGRLVDEFSKAWFGGAWKPMRNYVDTLHRAAMSSRCEGVMDCHAGPGQAFFRELLAREFLDKLHRCFAEAERLADSDLIKRRVWNEKWGLLFVDLFLHGRAGTDLVPEASEKGYRIVVPSVEDYRKTAELLRLTQLFNRPWEVAPHRKFTLSAIVGFEPTASPWWTCPRVRELMDNPAEAHANDGGKRTRTLEEHLVPLENEHLKVTLVPSLGGRIWRLYSKDRRQDLLWRGTLPWNLLQTGTDPDNYVGFGGYEEYLGEKFASPGWAEKYDCEVSPDGVSAAMSTSFPNGLRLRRTVTLLAEGPGIEIASMVTNGSQKAVADVVLRAHPQFSLKAGQLGLALQVTGKDGAWSKLPLKSETWLSGDQLPAGAWGVDTDGGKRIVNEFDVSEVASCYLYVSPSGDSYNLELFSQKKDLAPGETLALKHRYVLAQRG